MQVFFEKNFGLVQIHKIRYNELIVEGEVRRLNGLLSAQQVVYYALRTAVMLVALPVHESAHALVSHWLGDDTAKNAGRISLNPLRHFDPWGALCMVVGGVGWARPVGIDARRFREPKTGMALTAAAGPLSNLLLAWLSYALLKAAVYGGLTVSAPGYLAAEFLRLMTVMNISLAVFNLMPVPPFDGSRVAFLFLPQKLYFRVMKYERYIMLAVLALVFLGALDRPLSAAVGAVITLMDRLTCFVELLFGV